MLRLLGLRVVAQIPQLCTFTVYILQILKIFLEINFTDQYYDFSIGAEVMVDVC